MTRTLTTMPPLDVENITVGDMNDASERVAGASEAIRKLVGEAGSFAAIPDNTKKRARRLDLGS